MFKVLVLAIWTQRAVWCQYHSDHYGGGAGGGGGGSGHGHHEEQHEENHYVSKKQ